MASEDTEHSFLENLKNQNTESKIYFNVAEYSLFLIILSIIIYIIFKYNFVQIKYNESVSGYLFGGKTMGVLPVTLSLIASHISSVTLIGIPLEIYLNGTQYWASALSLLIVSIITSFVYLPVFYKLQLTSIFEYLEIRFSSHTRVLTSLLFVVNRLLLLPIIPFLPILAFSKVTNSWASRLTACICCACAALVAAGGLRAVTAAAGLAVVAAIAATALPPALAAIPLQGLNNVWKLAEEGGRIVLYDPDPELIHHSSFWAVTIGLGAVWLWRLGTNQSSIQRLLALPSINKARLCIALSYVGVIGLKSFSCLTGLIIYAFYAGCDPLLNGRIKRHEELIPQFLGDLALKFPGICGIFVGGLFCSTLCSLSASLNSLSGVIYEDFIRPWMPANTTDWAACFIMRILVLILGCGSAAAVLRIQDLDKLINVASGLTGVTAGTLLGVFTLGLVFHQSNCAGALSGTLASLLICGWLLMGAQHAIQSGTLTFENKPLTVDKCNATLPSNVTASYHHDKLNGGPQTVSDARLTIFRVSLTYCALAGAITVLLVGLPMSYLTGKARACNRNPDMFCPLTQMFLPHKKERRLKREEEDACDEESYSTPGKENEPAYLALDVALKQLKQITDN